MPVDDDGVRTFESGATRRLGWLIAAAIAVPIGVTIIAIVAIRLSPARSAAMAPPSVAPAPGSDVAADRAPVAAEAPARAADRGAPSLTTVAAPAGPS